MGLAEWLSVIRQIDAVRFHAIDPDIAIKSVSLSGELHQDPADRCIVATARKLAAPVLSADEQIRAYPHVRTIW